MGVKVRGVVQVKQRINESIDDIRTVRAVRALQSALILIGSEAAVLTPVDTSTLLNSQFREINTNGTLLTGRVGYSANYAVYVHNASGILKGKPRQHFGITSNHSEAGPQKPKEFGGGTGKGNYWDPGGEPHFLTKGAMNAKDAVAAVIKKELSR